MEVFPKIKQNTEKEKKVVSKIPDLNKWYQLWEREKEMRLRKYSEKTIGIFL